MVGKIIEWLDNMHGIAMKIKILSILFPQDTQMIIGTVLIVKCEHMILNILTR